VNLTIATHWSGKGIVSGAWAWFYAGLVAATAALMAYGLWVVSRDRSIATDTVVFGVLLVTATCLVPTRKAAPEQIAGLKASALGRFLFACQIITPLLMLAMILLKYAF
jgi:hypothetical protein